MSIDLINLECPASQSHFSLQAGIEQISLRLRNRTRRNDDLHGCESKEGMEVVKVSVSQNRGQVGGKNS